MSIMMQAMLFEKYGPRLTMEQLAEALCLSRATIYNRLSKGTLGIKTYQDGGRWAAVEDVAAYFEECRQRAR